MQHQVQTKKSNILQMEIIRHIRVEERNSQELHSCDRNEALLPTNILSTESLIIKEAAGQCNGCSAKLLKECHGCSNNKLNQLEENRKL